MHSNIRAVRAQDIEALKQVVDSSQLFPAEFLEEMIAEYLNNPETQELWFSYADGQTPLAVGYCVPEKLTEGTFNLLAIGVSQQAQRRGIARQMMAYIEQLLKQKGARVLIVETSSDEAQSAARALYRNLGYSHEATIRDFWKEGEDKIVFWKKL